MLTHLHPKYVPPKLIVPERVIRAMVDETLNHPPTETGQSLVGLESNPETIIVLGIIPDILDTLRQPGLFSLGGTDQVEIFRWLNRHWEAMRKTPSSGLLPPWQLGQIIPKGTIPKELNFPLRIVGDWHRHPGLYKTLSAQDVGTIVSILADPAQKRRQYLTPIAVFEQKRDMTWSLSGNELVVNQSTNRIRINWWFSSTSTPLKIHHLVPLIVPDNQLPWLPPIAWHLTDINRMRTELALLNDAGYNVRWTTKEINGDVYVQEVVFGIDHPSWQKRLLIVTQWDYPKSLPNYQLLEKPDIETQKAAKPEKESNMLQDLFSWLQRVISRPQTDIWKSTSPARRWDRQLYLVDVVKELDSELKGGIDESKSSASGS